jgi:hypothetical protein
MSPKSKNNYGGPRRIFSMGNNNDLDSEDEIFDNAHELKIKKSATKGTAKTIRSSRKDLQIHNSSVPT